MYGYKNRQTKATLINKPSRIPYQWLSYEHILNFTSTSSPEVVCNNLAEQAPLHVFINYNMVAAGIICTPNLEACLSNKIQTNFYF